ncbi:MAG: hypothetical protein AB8G05_24155 [Oligoflexales bacterium]
MSSHVSFYYIFLVIAGCGSRQLQFFEEDTPVHKPLAKEQTFLLKEPEDASLNLKELDSKKVQIKAIELSNN